MSGVLTPSANYHANTAHIDLSGFGNTPRRSANLGFTPTREQQLALDGVRRGEDMVVSASAGSGKTSFLVAAAAQLHADDPKAWGVYIVYNKDTAKDVGRKFVYGNIEASTIHSLANRACRRHPTLSLLMGKIGIDRHDPRYLWPREYPAFFGVPKTVLFYEHTSDDGQPYALVEHRPRPAASTKVIPEGAELRITRRAYRLCQDALKAINAWCVSDADELGAEHVVLPDVLGTDGDERNYALTPDHVAVTRYVSYVVNLARFIWDNDLMRPDGRLPLEHDHYLKAYALTHPSISESLGMTGRRGVLFFDEAQDSRPVTTRLVMDQRRDMQVVMCGDASQGIYRFAGCVNALAAFSEFDGVTHYRMTQTFRFGGAIAACANLLLPWIDVADVRVVPDLTKDATATLIAGANPAAALKVAEIQARGNPTVTVASSLDAVVCRTNAAVINHAISLLDIGAKVYCTADIRSYTELAYDIVHLRSGDTAKVRSATMSQFPDHAAFQRFMMISTGMEKVDNPDDESLLGLACSTMKVAMDRAMYSTLTAILERGCGEVIDAMRRMTRTEAEADVTVSTVHKAKGREWDCVLADLSSGAATVMAKIRKERGLSSDEPFADGDELQDLLMIAYVAFTRARRALYITDATRHVFPALVGYGGFEHKGSGRVMSTRDVRSRLDHPEKFRAADLSFSSATDLHDGSAVADELLDAVLPGMRRKTREAVTAQWLGDDEPVHAGDLVSATVLSAHTFCDMVVPGDRLAYSAALVARGGVRDLLQAADIMGQGMPAQLAGNIVELSDLGEANPGVPVNHLEELLTSADLPSRPGIYLQR